MGVTLTVLAAFVASSLVWVAGKAHVSGKGKAPSLLLVTIDTLRADHLGVYGDKKARTPNLDALALRGLVFEEAVTSVPLTLPSHATILSGLLPQHHGVHLNEEVVAGDRETLATLLKSRGYRTAAFVSSYVLDRRFGLARGFDTYDDRVPRGNLPQKRLGEDVTAAAVSWIGEQAGRFAAWVHYYDPHMPYDPPAAFGGAGDYDGEIAYVDSCLGRLLRAAQEQARGDLIVLIVADHGEDLGEHGEGMHGLFLYQSTLRVPLLLAGPGIPIGRRSGLARTVDILPTLMSCLGAPAPTKLDGVDLLRESPSESYAETLYPESFGWAPLHSLRRGRFKFIDAPHEELYDLVVDGRELHNEVGRQDSEVPALRQALQSLGPTSTPGPHSVDPAVEERLRALGYASGGAGGPNATMGRIDPKDVVETYRLYEEAYTAESSGNLPEAIDRFGILVRRDPQSILFQRGLAEGLNRAGRTREGLHVLDTLVRMAASDPNVWYERSKAHEAQNRIEEALRDAEKAAALDQTLPEVQNQLGVCRAKSGDLGAAVEAFAHAVSIDPSNGPIWANRASAEWLLGRVTDAHESFLHAAALLDRDAAPLVTLGTTAVRAGDLDDGIVAFQRARALVPGDAALQVRLARAEAAVRVRRGY